MHKINGIHCDVTSCEYNCNACECVADKVDIHCTCSEPNCSDETICKTFKPRSGCNCQ